MATCSTPDRNYDMSTAQNVPAAFYGDLVSRLQSRLKWRAPQINCRFSNIPDSLVPDQKVSEAIQINPRSSKNNEQKLKMYQKESQKPNLQQRQLAETPNAADASLGISNCTRDNHINPKCNIGNPHNSKMHHRRSTVAQNITSTI